MSRYELPGRVVYGFDEQLSQYFLDRGRRHVLGPLSKTYGTCYELMETLKVLGLWDKIPHAHQNAIAGDVPF